MCSYVIALIILERNMQGYLEKYKSLPAAFYVSVI